MTSSKCQGEVSAFCWIDHCGVSGWKQFSFRTKPSRSAEYTLIENHSFIAGHWEYQWVGMSLIPPLDSCTHECWPWEKQHHQLGRDIVQVSPPLKSCPGPTGFCPTAGTVTESSRGNDIHLSQLFRMVGKMAQPVNSMHTGTLQPFNWMVDRSLPEFTRRVGEASFKYQG